MDNFHNLKFKSLIDLIKQFPTEEDCIIHLEKLRWSDHIYSPFISYGTATFNLSDSHTFLCVGTRKQFTVRTNTMFEGKIPLLKWFVAVYMYRTRKKITADELKYICGTTTKQSELIIKRLNKALKPKK